MKFAQSRRKNVYFDGDPATDSARRHLERVLKQPKARRRWSRVAAAVAVLAAWQVWPRGQVLQNSK